MMPHTLDVRHSLATSRRSFTLVEMLVAIGIIVILAAITVSASVALVQRSEVKSTQNTLRLLDMALREWESQADRKLTWGENGVPRSDSIYEVRNKGPQVYTLTEVLYVIRRSSQVQELLAQIRPDVMPVYDTNGEKPPWVRDGRLDDPDPNRDRVERIFDNNDLAGGTTPDPIPLDGELAVLDAWGQPIRAVHPGRVHNPAPPFFDSDEADPDGTINLDEDSAPEYLAEQIYGTCLNRRVLFVSAGPDGKFGIIDPESQDDEAQHDFVHDNVYSYAVVDEGHQE